MFDHKQSTVDKAELKYGKTRVIIFFYEEEMERKPFEANLMFIIAN